MKNLLCGLTLALGAVPSMAPAATATLVSPKSDSVLRAGTPVAMKTREALTTKGKLLKVGQRVQLEVAADVIVNGQIAIPAGTPGVGEITIVRNKGMWGKSGGINGRVLFVRVGDRQIRMSGTFDDKGKTGTVGVVAAVALIPIAGFFTTGTSAEIALGQPVQAFLDEDVPVAMADGATGPAPIKAVAPAALPAAQVADSAGAR